MKSVSDLRLLLGMMSLTSLVTVGKETTVAIDAGNRWTGDDKYTRTYVYMCRQHTVQLQIRIVAIVTCIPQSYHMCLNL